MPKFPAIPRLSIVVPVTDDLAGFEKTLISVLENQPPASEILVPHDGSYQDPYQLCDEVRFVMSDSMNAVDQIAAAAMSARGRFVHILSDALTATPGWTEAGLEPFEHFDCGMVAPTIHREQDQQILATGWCDNSAGLCRPATGRTKTEGVYLQASFWRRELLRSMQIAFRNHQAHQVSYAYSLLARQAGWTCQAAPECVVRCSQDNLPWETPSLWRGASLRAIHNHFYRGGWMKSAIAAGQSALLNVLKPSLISEALGQTAAPMLSQAVSRQLRIDEVTRCHEERKIVAMPNRRREEQPFRRAA